MTLKAKPLRYSRKNIATLSDLCMYFPQWGTKLYEMNGHSGGVAWLFLLYRLVLIQEKSLP